MVIAIFWIKKLYYFLSTSYELLTKGGIAKPLYVQLVVYYREIFSLNKR